MACGKSKPGRPSLSRAASRSCRSSRSRRRASGGAHSPNGSMRSRRRATCGCASAITCGTRAVFGCFLEYRACRKRHRAPPPPHTAHRRAPPGHAAIGVARHAVVARVQTGGGGGRWAAAVTAHASRCPSRSTRTSSGDGPSPPKSPSRREHAAQSRFKSRQRSRVRARVGASSSDARAALLARLLISHASAPPGYALAALRLANERVEGASAMATATQRMHQALAGYVAPSRGPPGFGVPSEPLRARLPLSLIHI